MDHQDYVPLITKFWSSSQIKGKVAFVLKEKSKGLKECLRQWNKYFFGILDLEVAQEVMVINDLDQVVKEEFSINLNQVEVDRREATSKIWKSMWAK